MKFASEYAHLFECADMELGVRKLMLDVTNTKMRKFSCCQVDETMISRWIVIEEDI